MDREYLIEERVEKLLTLTRRRTKKENKELTRLISIGRDRDELELTNRDRNAENNMENEIKYREMEYQKMITIADRL